jgi:hypothetical protein
MMAAFTCKICKNVVCETPYCNRGHGAMVLSPTKREQDLKSALLEVVTHCGDHGREAAHQALANARLVLAADESVFWKEDPKRSVAKVLGPYGHRAYVVSVSSGKWSAGFADHVEHGDRGNLGNDFQTREDAKARCEQHIKEQSK